MLQIHIPTRFLIVFVSNISSTVYLCVNSNRYCDHFFVGAMVLYVLNIIGSVTPEHSESLFAFFHYKGL